jgi:hypothetical protein
VCFLHLIGSVWFIVLSHTNTSIPIARKKEVRAEERDRAKTGAHDIMHNDIAMPEMTKSIKAL